MRRGAEWALRLALVAMLALSLWRATHEGASGPVTRTTRASDLTPLLAAATRTNRIGALEVEMDAFPAPAQRAWLVALRRAGVDVRWRGAVPVMAVAAERVREPRAAVRVLLTSGAGAAYVLSDSAGALDSLTVPAAGATLEAADVVGPVRARQGAYLSSVVAPEATPRRDVLVLGRASWESRFVSSALSEAGWRVRARIPTAPGVAVTDPAMLPLDTARYDVVVALDSTAADLGSAIERFIATGGGLVAVGSATTMGALRPLVPARAGTRRPGRILLDTDSMSRSDLPLRPLEGLSLDAVVLERRPDAVAVAVRRAGLGRVLAVGYDESWRWRMLGGVGGPAAHRRWWSHAVGLVAPERDVPPSMVGSGDAAPVAMLVGALGPASLARLPALQVGQRTLPLALLIVIVAALLAETASRRFRGAR
ncbi:MAG: hypothetical protein ABIV10_14665 [Gemmatimonadaceae bacterium]